MTKRKIAILGATGSIGTQALDVVRQHRDLFEVETLSANNNFGLLAAQAREFDVSSVVICNPEHYRALSDSLADTSVKVFAGIDSACELVSSDSADIVLSAQVGFSGLKPTLAAIRAGKVIALANKETLVAAGGLVMPLAKRMKAPVIPVDSEHSAIFQCLMGAAGNNVRRILLTASGGPFRNWERSRIEQAGPEAALRHPRWNMGAKITIDSATMMNKGFEMIEACWLFDTRPEDIDIIVHPESVIHSMVEFEDGAVLAQLAWPDMREPIAFALAFPERLPLSGRKLDFARLGTLSFEAADSSRFPCLSLAYDAISRGGLCPCVMNAANEVAVQAYLEEKIRFYDIPGIISKCMESTPAVQDPSEDDIFQTDRQARVLAGTIIKEKKW